MDRIELLKFKCEINIGGPNNVIKYFFAADLSELHNQIRNEFPSGRIVSILGV